MRLSWSVAFVFILLRKISLVCGTVIRVSNGGRLGDWGDWDWCPPGSVPRGFSTKTEPKQVFDDTALNGIMLFCAEPYSDAITGTITSSVGKWGRWSPVVWCPTGYLVSFSLRVEPYSFFTDNTAANNIRFLCSDYSTVLEGQGLTWGTWGEWSDVCYKGIGGMRTRVQAPQGWFIDDTAFNDVEFICSEY